MLSLIKKGMTREDAYALVQKNAMRVWEERIDFKQVLLNDEDAAKLANAFPAGETAGERYPAPQMKRLEV